MSQSYGGQYTAGKEAPSTSDGEGRAAGRYQSLMKDRQPFLDRARECSELTLPYLIPPDGWTGTTPLYTPFQAIGSRGVNNISAKLMLALFPPNSPFARMRMDGRAEDQAKQADPKMKDKVEADLANYERKIAAEVEIKAWRPHLHEGIKHLIVGGNVLLFFPKDEAIETGTNIRVFHLDRYVIKRDPSGNILEIAVKESVSPRSLPDKFYDQVKQVVGYKGDDKTCDLYTYVRLDQEEKKWKVFQEVHGLIVPESEGAYAFDQLPWLALRWTKIDGEDYGRGYVEEYLGDLKSAEGLSQAIVEGSAAAAKVLFLTNPNGVTRASDIEQAPNGAVRSGNAADVTVLQLEKFNDFRVAQETALNIEKRLAQAFMLNSSVQRSGERVTAEEWRYMIQDIEDSLGGIYSVLAHELQLPLVKLLIVRMTKEKKLPPLPKGSVRPVIVTGLEALGRGHDLEKLRAFIKDAIVTLTPEVAARYLNFDNLLERFATGAGIDPTGLIKTEEEMQAQAQAEAQAAQMQQIMGMIEKLGPAGIKMASDQQKGKASGEGNAGGVGEAGAGGMPSA